MSCTPKGLSEGQSDGQNGGQSGPLRIMRIAVIVCKGPRSNPFRVNDPRARAPRVALGAQPWAKRYNPFGIALRRRVFGRQKVQTPVAAAHAAAEPARLRQSLPQPGSPPARSAMTTRLNRSNSHYGGARLAQPQRVALRRHSSPMRHSGLLRLGQPRSAIMRIAGRVRCRISCPKGRLYGCY